MMRFSIHCDECGAEILEDDEYYHIEKKDLCTDCAHDWLDQFKEWNCPFCDDGDDRE